MLSAPAKRGTPVEESGQNRGLCSQPIKYLPRFLQVAATWLRYLAEGFGELFGGTLTAVSFLMILEDVTNWALTHFEPV
jgi:hypothetical protein